MLTGLANACAIFVVVRGNHRPFIDQCVKRSSLVCVDDTGVDKFDVMNNAWLDAQTQCDILRDAEKYSWRRWTQ